MGVSDFTERGEGIFIKVCIGDLFSTVINCWGRNPGEVGDPSDEENVALRRGHDPNCDNIGDTDETEIATGTGDEELDRQGYDEQYGQCIPKQTVVEEGTPISFGS